MTKTKTDSNQVSIHQQNSKQKWIIIKQTFLVEINGHRNICNKLGVVGKGLVNWLLASCVLLTYKCNHSSTALSNNSTVAWFTIRC